MEISLLLSVDLHQSPQHVKEKQILVLREEQRQGQILLLRELE